MSSRKKAQNHNIFEDTKDHKQLHNKEEVEEAYANQEQMTIPRFENQVVKDSAWSKRTDTR